MTRTSVAILVLIGLSLLLAAAVAFQGLRLDSERLAHNATRVSYAKDRALWLEERRGAAAAVVGLTRQVNATRAACRDEREAEEERFAIFANATAQAVPEGVVDEATDKAAVRHINAALDRLCGLRR